MNRRLELLIPLILAITIAASGLWFFINNLNNFTYYDDLSKHGVRTGAVLIKKGILLDGRLVRYGGSDSSGEHHFIVNFDLPDGANVTCGFGVSQTAYDSISPRDQLRVIYPPGDPEHCTLPFSIEENRLLALSVLSISVFLVLLAAGLACYIYFSFRKPVEPPALTTDLGMNGTVPDCPRCGSTMEEGYIPAVGGVSWRNRDEAVGIPTMLSGLPGTTSWIKRPMLHGFRCEDCGIITFGYLKKPVSRLK